MWQDYNRCRITNCDIFQRPPGLAGLGKELDYGLHHLLEYRVTSSGLEPIYLRPPRQRAIDPELEQASVVSKVPLPGPALAVAAGNHHTLVLVDGAVYAFVG